MTGTINLAIEGGTHDASNPAGRDYFNSKPRLTFADAADETHHYTFRMPENYASGLTLKAQYSMESATSGNVILAAQVMAVSDGDSAAVDTDSYDTANTSSATAVPGTAGYIDEISLTLSNADSVAAGDWVAIKIFRDADNASDTATGDLELIALSLEYTTS
jgi:hypothetical protein